MKKILYILFTFMLFGITFAADVDFSGAIGTNSMPTDEEIWKMIGQFNIPNNQKQQVFEATKKKLSDMYSTEDVTKANQELNDASKILESGAIDDFIKPGTKRKTMRTVKRLPHIRSGSVETVD